PAASPSRPATSPGQRGPGLVDRTPQGTVRNANSPQSLQAALEASQAGDTVVLAGGSYGAQSFTRSVTEGLIRITPAAQATVTFGRTTISGDGLDFRGIDTTDQVTIVSGASNVFWRGGIHTRLGATHGFYVNGAVTAVTVEDVKVRGADCSFYIQGTTTSLPKGVTLQRFHSENVIQDHVFGSRGSNVTIRDFITSGHTDTTEHSDGVQIVGLKDVLIANGEITNPVSLRDNAYDRHDQGVMINYDPRDGSGRIPERITIDGLLLRNQTSTGIAVAGVRGLIISNTTGQYNGQRGLGADGLRVDPDPGNVITEFVEKNNTWDRRTVTDVT
ncbi:hypothetical protein OF117_14940, partial [Geodermatophilus sp. YIM 151500]|uniref:hypothetical protein n=1 Tax=Geodermatophilus sp. YIM 151500 TaxID=2984531 RepID=UPI0021E442CD